jgi:hypothetical protein
MAKMQGFGGKADAALVNAATRAAYAGAPKDLSGIFNNIAQSYAVGMSQLGAGIAQAAKAAGSAAGTAIAEAKKQDELIQAGGKYFEGQTETLQQQLENIKQEREEIRSQTGFLSKDRREQMRANRRKEDKIYASLAQIDNVMQEAKSSFIEGGLDHVMMGEDSNNFFSTFFAGGGEVKNAKGEVIGSTKIDFDENGNEVISFLDADGNVKNNKYGKPMQGDIEFVKDLMVMKDPKTKEQAAKLTQLLYNTGKSGGAWDENTQNQLRNNLNDLINERTVGSMLREKFGTQKQSFFDALTTVDTKESAQMFNLLNNQFQFTDKSLDVTGPNGKPDGKIDEKDFAKDASKFISVLTDKTHPNYDPSATKQAYIDFLIDGEAKTQWQMGNNVYNKNQAAESSDKINYRANAINLFNQGANMVPIDQYNTAIKQDDGTYITVKNSDQSKTIEGGVSRSASDYIQYLGGTVDEKTQKKQQQQTNLKSDFMQIEKDNLKETKAYEKIIKLFPHVTKGNGGEGTGTINDADAMSAYVVKYDGKKYRVNSKTEMESLYNAIIANDPLNPNK